MCFVNLKHTIQINRVSVNVLYFLNLLSMFACVVEYREPRKDNNKKKPLTSIQIIPLSDVCFEI